jgi:hypothetical protein
VESERDHPVNADDGSSDGGTTIQDAGAADPAGVTDSSSTDATSSDATSSDTAASDTSAPDAPSGSPSAPAPIGGWSDAVAGGWNSGERSVGNVRRIPLAGLKTVNQDPAPYTATTESATGRAILVVPASLDTSQPIDVLLHLHGHNIGYRQRVASNLPDAGSVRDVLVDQIEDQLERSGRAMIAVLPQGTLVSGFAPSGATFDCDSFLDEVLNAAVTAGVWPSCPTVSRVVLSGHSGGGNTIGPLSGQSGQPHLPSKIAAMFLFEAINGSNELAGITTYVTLKLNADLAALASGSDQLDYLKSSFRFRGVYNTQDDFYATNYATLTQTIASWFAKNAAALGGKGSDAYNALSANYVVVNPSPFVVHDGLLGSGNLLLALGMLP